MPLGNLRKTVTLVLSACGVVLVLSWAFAGYLAYKRSQPVAPVEKAEGPPPPRKIDGLLARAAQQIKEGNVEQALVRYREALSVEPRSLEAQLGVAQAELLAGREDVAAGEYERVLKLDRNHKAALAQLAAIYSHQAKSWPQAEARYRQYLALDPKDPKALLGLARVLAWQGEAEEVASLYSRPDVARLMTTADLRNQAFALVKLRRWGQAEVLLKKLLAGQPDDTRLQILLAGVYATRKDWNSALPLYRALLGKNPRDPQLNLDLGLALLASKNYRAALGPLRLARDRLPANAEAGLGYARALKGAGDLKKSCREYEHVMPHYARDASVIREYADALLERRDYRKSATYYEAASKLGLRDERLLMGYGGALAGQRKYKAALPYLEEAYRRAPTDRVAFELAKVLQKLGRNDRALELIRHVEGSALRAAR